MGLIVRVNATIDKLMARVILSPKPFPFEADTRVEGAPLKNVLQMSRDELNEADVLAPSTALHVAVPELVSVAHHIVTRNDAKPRNEPFFSHSKVSAPWQQIAQPIYDLLYGSTAAYLTTAERFLITNGKGLPYYSLAQPKDNTSGHLLTIDWLTALTEAWATSLEQYYIQNWPTPLNRTQAAKLEGRCTPVNITSQKVVAVFRDGSTDSGRLLCELRMAQNDVVRCVSLLASDQQVNIGLTQALSKRINSVHALAAECAEEPAFPAQVRQAVDDLGPLAAKISGVGIGDRGDLATLNTQLSSAIELTSAYSRRRDELDIASESH